MTKLMLRCFKLSEGHVETLAKYGNKWNCGNDTEALRFLLNECKRKMEDKS